MTVKSRPHPKGDLENAKTGEKARAHSPVVIPNRLYFRIGDVSEILGVKPYVLRFWETEFPMVSPQKSNTGQRVYRRGDVEALAAIKTLLYKERYSIEGARRKIRELRKEGALKAFSSTALEESGSFGESGGESSHGSGDESGRLIQEARTPAIARAASSSGALSELLQDLQQLSRLALSTFFQY